MGGFCWPIDAKWKFALALVGSTLPGVDAVELLFGPSGVGVNHVVKSVGGYEVHAIRWDDDPSRFLTHLFEIFENGAGARLEPTSRKVFVDGAGTLFPERDHGLSFCNRAINFLNFIPPEKRSRFEPK